MTQNINKSLQENIDDQAQSWMVLLYSGEATEQDQADFQNWMNEPSHKASFEMLDGLWESLDIVPDIEIISSEETRQNTRYLRSRKLMFGTIGAVAASILIFIMINFYDPVTENHYATKTGEVRTVGLADGSKVTLRAETSLFTIISKNRRTVIIEHGGAYFEVKRDEGRYFRVTAGDAEISVLGTVFDVLKGPQDVTVSVNEGSVLVENKFEAIDESSSMRQTVQLKAGQQVKAGKQGSLSSVKAFDAGDVLAWRNGRLSYKSARLEDIVADINRYRKIKIYIADDSLKDLNIMSSFNVDNSDQMLRSIANTEDVVITRSSEKIIISKKKKQSLQ